MLIENETKNIFDKKIIRNKIPKCKKSAKNIPFPTNKYSKNIKQLLPIRQSSIITFKENTTNLSHKYPSDNNFQILNKNNIFSSFQKSKNKIQKCNLNKRQNSWEKSKIIKNNDPIKKIKIEQIHNYKIQYLLLKEKIKIFSDRKNISLEEKNKEIKEISSKLNFILEKSNEYLEEQNQENDAAENLENNYKTINSNNIERNKKILDIYYERYEKWHNILNQINNHKYILNLYEQIKEIDSEINLYEKENEYLLANNGNKNDIILPCIQKINKIDNDLILNRQLQNKIAEYKDKIAQEIEISKKIKDNEINIKKLDNIIHELNGKSNNKESIFNGENTFNDKVKFLNINKEIFKFKFNKKKKLSKLNEFLFLKNENKSNLNNTTSTNKESKNRIITSENQSNLEENIHMIPFTTKRKNLSCSNISVIDQEKVINNKKIKELILKNLDLKEKEEKALINIHEDNNSNNNSLKKYKHIKLKPNFSFTNDYHKFKDDTINKYKKLQSSAEITNLKNNENNINNININLNNNKEDLIKESVVDDSENKVDIQNIASIEKSSKFNRNKRIKDIFEENNKVNNDIGEIKKERFSTTTEQRQKVLNTILYDDI